MAPKAPTPATAAELLAKTAKPKKAKELAGPTVETRRELVDYLLQAKKAEAIAAAKVAAAIGELLPLAQSVYEEKGKAGEYASSVYFTGTGEGYATLVFKGTFANLPGDQRDTITELLASSVGPRPIVDTADLDALVEKGEISPTAHEQMIARRQNDADERWLEAGRCLFDKYCEMKSSVSLAAKDESTLQMLNILMQLATEFAMLPADWKAGDIKKLKEYVDQVRALVGAGAVTEFAQAFTSTEPVIAFDSSIAEVQFGFPPDLRAMLVQSKPSPNISAKSYNSISDVDACAALLSNAPTAPEAEAGPAEATAQTA